LRLRNAYDTKLSDAGLRSMSGAAEVFSGAVTALSAMVLVISICASSAAGHDYDDVHLSCISSALVFEETLGTIAGPGLKRNC
jgi:hypothetical protein